jgi:DNA helicase-2/ATP-dependent DNA helicase PcrA
MALITKHYQVASDQIMSKLFIQVVHDVFLGHLDQDNNHQDIDYLNQLYQKILTAEKLESRLNISDLLELIEMELDAGDTGLMKFNWEDSDVVKVMTIHSAKGLEFDQVFVVNMVDKRFPSIGISDKIPLLDSLVKEALPEGDYHLQEERRLCYVAMTRAKSGLYLTRALDYGGATKKKPSVFIAQAKVTNQFNMENVQSTQLEKDLAVMGQAVQLNNRSLVSNKFSFSQLQAFETCPWQYRYAYILKVPTEDKPTAIFGRLMHSVLKDYFAPCLISATPDLFSSDTVVDLSLERLQAIFNNSWSDYGYGSQETVEKYKTKGQQMIESMARISNEQKAPKILQLENQFMFKLNDYYLKGAIDRIDQLDDGSVEIIDYKTGSPKDKLDFEIKKQLLLYQVAMGSAKGLTVSKLSYYYLESGDKLSFTAKEAELEKLKHWALETIEAIRRMEFTAKPGQLCKFCDFKNICEYRA